MLEIASKTKKVERSNKCFVYYIKQWQILTKERKKSEKEETQEENERMWRYRRDESAKD